MVLIADLIFRYAYRTQEPRSQYQDALLGTRRGPAGDVEGGEVDGPWMGLSVRRMKAIQPRRVGLCLKLSCFLGQFQLEQMGCD